MNQKSFVNIILVVVIVVLVGAVGYFAFVKKSEPIAEQPIPTPTQTTNPTGTPKQTSPTPTATPDKTANWKTYSNSGLNFSINYPDGFQLKEDNATSKLFSGTDGHFWIFIENNTKNLDAAGLKDDYYKNDEYGYQYQDSFVKVAGVNSYKQGRYDLGVIEKYYIPKSGKIYRIEFEFNFDVPNQNLKESKINLISDVLSTFKFAN